MSKVKPPYREVHRGSEVDIGAFSRNKGARLERDAANWLEDATGIKFRRALDQYQASSGRDLEGDSPLVVQVKGGKAPRVWAAYAEAEAEAKPGEIPLALVKRDRYPWLVVLNRSDFGPMLAAWLRERERERSAVETVSGGVRRAQDLRVELRQAQESGDEKRVDDILQEIRDCMKT